MLPETPRRQSLEIAERLRARIEQRNSATPQGIPVAVSISIGVALRTDETPDLDALLARADHALYEAKRGGRNRIFADVQETHEAPR